MTSPFLSSSSGTTSEHGDEFLAPTTATHTHTSAACPTDAEVERFDDFEAMGLDESLLRGIFAYGLERPSAIQQKAIVPAAAGRDVLMHAQSGTGKTAAFSIGLLQRLDTSRAGTQALILSPTRDLAQQTERVLTALGAHHKVTVHASIGGKSGREDGDALRRGPHVVTGTPGRVMDNIQRGSLDIRRIDTLVLDEVDVMLDEGFVEAVRDVIQSLPATCQVLCVSATYTPAVHDICDKILREPVKIVIAQEDIQLSGIKQFYIDCGSDGAKIDVLLDLYTTLTAAQSIVFVNTRRRAMDLAREMDAADHTVSVIHGEMSQQEREATLAEFSQGASRVLIATDILARGYDAQQVSMVVNLELPRDRSNYIHRIGRCGRFGRKGVAINLLGGEFSRDAQSIRELEQYYCCDISEMPANVADFFN